MGLLKLESSSGIDWNKCNSVDDNFVICVRVTETLEVKIVKTKDLTAAEKLKINASFSNVSPSGKLSASKVDLESKSDSPKLVSTSGEDKSDNQAVARGALNTSKQEWLSNLSQNFQLIVVGGMDISMRTKVSKKISEHLQLRGKENQAVINSVNHHIFEFIGNQRPEKGFCRYLIESLRGC